ncbi:hypothetical protein LPJ73_000603 [Coemansia sp. RSA 2703]|nr:hypothetical protein LPJ73_000603 [Coemansia sp. RSA 2703]KAJ2376382.1 hypothetical protein IW150_002021 [Coemansia sp. RSA 2607]KAJ2398308.1 hypothetical protein GGI05_000164 [Coemansia sp. RSA 2603]
MSSQPAKEQENGGPALKQAEGSVSLSGVIVCKMGEWIETVATLKGALEEGKHEAGKVMTMECMQKMEHRLDDVCALLQTFMTGRHIGEGARPVEYTPLPGGALSRFEYQEQPLYGTLGTAVYRLQPFAGEEGSVPGNPRIEAMRKQGPSHVIYKIAK